MHKFDPYLCMQNLLVLENFPFHKQLPHRETNIYFQFTDQTLWQIFQPVLQKNLQFAANLLQFAICTSTKNIIVQPGSFTNFNC